MAQFNFIHLITSIIQVYIHLQKYSLHSMYLSRRDMYYVIYVIIFLFKEYVIYLMLFFAKELSP